MIELQGGDASYLTPERMKELVAVKRRVPVWADRDGYVVSMAAEEIGETARLLDDKNIYLGCQIEFADLGVCYGVVADTGFILISRYSVNGSEPELIVYQKR